MNERLFSAVCPGRFFMVAGPFVLSISDVIVIMVKKFRKIQNQKPDIPAQDEPEKLAEVVSPHQDKKIPLSVVLVALVVLGCVILLGSNLLSAARSPELPADANTTLTAIYFYGNGCSACDKVKPLITDIQARYPELHIEMLEVNGNRTNWDTFVTMRRNGFDNTTWALPTIFIGKTVLVGQTEIKDHFEEMILTEKQRIAAGNSS
jgi:thiol-disulfide isomerase/thioredoxin